MEAPCHAIDPTELKGRKLGRVLTKLGKVTREQVHEGGCAIQKTRKAPIGQLLVELGLLHPAHDINEALAGQAGMSYLDLSALRHTRRRSGFGCRLKPCSRTRSMPIEHNPRPSG